MSHDNVGCYAIVETAIRSCSHNAQVIGLDDVKPNSIIDKHLEVISV